MEYEGYIETIKQFEQHLKQATVCTLHYRPEDDLFGLGSGLVTTIVYDIMTWNYYFPVRILYDSRNNTGTIKIRDRDVWRLCKVAPDILKTIAALTPMKTEPPPTGKNIVSEEATQI